MDKNPTLNKVTKKKCVPSCCEVVAQVQSIKPDLTLGTGSNFMQSVRCVQYWGSLTMTLARNKVWYTSVG